MYQDHGVPFKAPEYRLLLSDARIVLSPRGTAKEMMERIFENKDHIINMLKLDRTAILNAPTDAGRPSRIRLVTLRADVQQPG